MSGELGQEGKLNIPFLSAKEAYPAILFIHPLLHHSSIDHVPSGSRAAGMGCLLHSWSHVYPKYSSMSPGISIYSALPPI